MALIAGHGHVRSRKRETSLAMIGDRERGAVKVLDRVAALTPVLIRGRGKLGVVRVLVTIQTGSEFYFVPRILASRDMAFGALHSGVLTKQGVLRCRMFLHAKKRWFPTLHSVTFRAFALLGAVLKLALVRIGLMAIGAGCERQRLFEFSIHMTIAAADFCVESKQWILCF